MSTKQCAGRWMEKISRWELAHKRLFFQTASGEARGQAPRKVRPGRAIPARSLLIKGGNGMKRVKTLTSKTLKNTMAKGGCGECQTSCQSACKTSCTVGNQSCENNK